MSETIKDREGPAHAIVAAIHDVPKQGIPGHTDTDTVKSRFTDAMTLVNAALVYNKARQAGQDPDDAVRHTAIALIQRYRLQHHI
jgi:hypothetical protein